MPRLTIDLPWPPSVNAIWRSYNGRVLLSREGRRFRERGIPLVQAAMLAGGVRTLFCPVSLAISLYPPTRRKLEADNRIKAVQDLLEHAGLIQNDSQIFHVEATRLECRPGGLAVATLEWLEQLEETP